MLDVLAVLDCFVLSRAAPFLMHGQVFHAQWQASLISHKTALLGFLESGFLESTTATSILQSHIRN
jgi:hypothetical protein